MFALDGFIDHPSGVAVTVAQGEMKVGGRLLPDTVEGYGDVLLERSAPELITGYCTPLELIRSDGKATRVWCESVLPNADDAQVLRVRDWHRRRAED